MAAVRRLFFFCRSAADYFIIQFSISCSYKSVLRSSITMTSGRLLKRIGIMLLPNPRLTIIFVLPFVNSPASTKSPVITIMSGSFSDNNSSSFILFFPNYALCKSEICAIRNPENESGIWLLEILIVLTVNAVSPHIVQISRTTKIILGIHIFVIRAFLVISFLIFPHHFSDCLQKNLITNRLCRKI